MGFGAEQEASGRLPNHLMTPQRKDEALLTSFLFQHELLPEGENTESLSSPCKITVSFSKTFWIQAEQT